MLLEAMASMQEEKARLSLLVESLRKEKAAVEEQCKALAESHASDMESLRRSLCEMHRAQMDELKRHHSAEVSSLKGAIATLRKTIDDLNGNVREMADVNAALSGQLENAMAAGRLHLGKRFARSAEQSRLLNNRNVDGRGEEKDRFDGNPPTAGGCAGASAEAASAATGRRKKKSAGRKPSLEDYDCDEIVYHKLEDTFTLPEGCRFKTRNGEVEKHTYCWLEFIPGRIVKHVCETATYIDAMGDSHNTLPEEERRNPVKGCPFSAEMLAFILIEKYGYHTCKNQIKHKLREMGARFSKSTFNKYFQLSARALRDMLESIFEKAAVDCDYLMLDETCELVGVIDDYTLIPEYRRRYLWAIFNPAAGLVRYLYEKGSRARSVITAALAGFKGTVSTDFYSAYLIFDDDKKYPDIMRAGCWTHCRRNFIDGLNVAGELCRKFIGEIGALFGLEARFREMGLHEKPEERRLQRQKNSIHVVNRIFAMARSVAMDPAMMGVALVKKAINYLLNQEQALRNFLLDGKAEISNNIEEQRMKTIKLDLKNCQNIGSEEAAVNTAFMHSLVESCRLNGKNPYDYLLALFRKMREPLDDIGKRMLLPDRWVPEC